MKEKSIFTAHAYKFKLELSFDGYLSVKLLYKFSNKSKYWHSRTILKIEFPVIKTKNSKSQTIFSNENFKEFIRTISFSDTMITILKNYNFSIDQIYLFYAILERIEFLLKTYDTKKRVISYSKKVELNKENIENLLANKAYANTSEIGVGIKVDGDKFLLTIKFSYLKNIIPEGRNKRLKFSKTFLVNNTIKNNNDLIDVVKYIPFYLIMVNGYYNLHISLISKMIKKRLIVQIKNSEFKTNHSIYYAFFNPLELKIYGDDADEEKNIKKIPSNKSLDIVLDKITYSVKDKKNKNKKNIILKLINKKENIK